MEKGPINGRMGDSFKEIEKITKWTGKVYLCGLMGDNIKGITWRIKSMGLDCLYGLMVILMLREKI